MAAPPKAPAKPAAAGGAAPAKPVGKKGLLMPIAIGLVVAIAAGGGVAFFMTRGATKPKPSEEVPAETHESEEEGEKSLLPAEYIALEPAFTVNLADETGDRYLQVEVQLMSRNPKLKEMVEKHNPVIRDRLLSLFSQQTTEGLRTREAKDKLKEEALKEVQDVLKEATGKRGVDALYFTSFVTQ